MIDRPVKRWFSSDKQVSGGENFIGKENIMCAYQIKRAPKERETLPKKENSLITWTDTGISLSNIEHFPGYVITKHLGLVQGSTVRAKHVGRDILAGLKNIVGGELKAYTELLNESRQEALSRMTQQAIAVGANAVINVRFSTANIAAGAAEILAYGTAVVIERIPEETAVIERAPENENTLVMEGAPKEGDHG
jgi:uncharacterized protein YbjQ (UPF0145 family)